MEKNYTEIVLNLAKQAKDAARILATTSAEQKNTALSKMAGALRAQETEIIAANAKDLEHGKSKGLNKAMMDRLALDSKRIGAMAKGLEDIAELDDPVGKTLAKWDRPNGLNIERISVPLGVIGVIYESRPNVTADAGGLCLKSGNAVILRGGSESFHSSQAILNCLQAGLKEARLPEAAIQSIPTTDRAAVGELLKCDEYIDIIVPRGGKGLIKRVAAESTVPVIKHLDGICHTYIHAQANPEMAQSVALNAKMRRTGICGATETVLIDRAAAAEVAPALIEALKEAGCEVRGDAEIAKLADVTPATEDDWATEYLDAVISIKTISGVQEAIDHINHYGSQHTDAIITEDEAAAEQFINGIDNAITMVNTSTQFADGGEFGMGAEIGISTGKLHARGPVGVEQLTTYKYIVRGTGQRRPT